MEFILSLLKNGLNLAKTKDALYFLILFFLLLLFSHYKKNLMSCLSGRKGERKIKHILNKILKNRFLILHDILLPLYDKTTQIDHIIIGSFGVLCIETKNHKGLITGRKEDTYLLQEIGGQTHSFYNPLLQNETHTKVISYLLKKEGLKNVPVYSLVVFSSNQVRISLEEKDVPIILSRYLKEYFKQKGFDANKIDKEKVFNALSNHLILDKRVRKKHAKYLQRKYS